MRRRQNGSALGGNLARERVAEEAARLMIEQGIRDFATAKRKAAERLHLSSHGALPTNAMIESRLAARQRIFEAEDHGVRLSHLRMTALQVMKALSAFEPRLVGTVLAGTATINPLIELHTFSDNPELVATTINDSGWDYRAVERRSRFNKNISVRVPAYRFTVADCEVRVEVYMEDGIRQAPLSPVDQSPMRRAGAKTVAALLNS